MKKVLTFYIYIFIYIEKVPKNIPKNIPKNTQTFKYKCIKKLHTLYPNLNTNILKNYILLYN